MTKFPIIDLHVRDMGEQVTAAFMAHQRDVASYIERGIAQAVQGLDAKLVAQAAEEAEHQARQMVESYFRHGEGRVAIEAIVKKALAPIAEALTPRSAARKKS